jgi:hypothetical protein
MKHVRIGRKLFILSRDFDTWQSSAAYRENRAANALPGGTAAPALESR